MCAGFSTILWAREKNVVVVVVVVVDDDIEDDENDLDNKHSGNPKIHSVIEFVTGALLTDLGVERNHNEPPDLIEDRSEIMHMRKYARTHKLDTKQRIAFEVICCTFMLH